MKFEGHKMKDSFCSSLLGVCLIHTRGSKNTLLCVPTRMEC